jgi:hypothetical protein
MSFDLTGSGMVVGAVDSHNFEQVLAPDASLNLGIVHCRHSIGLCFLNA